MRSTSLRTAVIAAGVFLIAMLPAQSARAQIYKVLQNFCPDGPPCLNGANPYAGLIRDAKGNLYGTTLGGSKGTCNYFQTRGCGTVFSLSKSGRETVLYRFTGGSDGGAPYGGVIRDDKGNLYGTTFYGGKLSCEQGQGCGTVFKLSKTGKETVLYAFKGGADGANPYAGVTRDANGNLFGTTWIGGDVSCDSAAGCGTVFKLSRTGDETVVYSFKGAPDGAYPYAGLIRDEKGNLYGTTKGGGSAECKNGCGTVFRVSRTGKETPLYSFKGEADGLYPSGGVIRDADGNLYGTTTGDGLPNVGTVFRISPAGEETVLYSFDSGGGAFPFAGVIRDAKGNLYGTTNGGGVYEGCGGGGCGVVFKLDSTGRETVLCSFNSQPGCTSGAFPFAGMIQDSKGNLYGTAWSGGTSGWGVVFKLTP
jgi:uncharacterized repeat protein (TIGR03803 family)